MCFSHCLTWVHPWYKEGFLNFVFPVSYYGNSALYWLFWMFNGNQPRGTSWEKSEIHRNPLRSSSRFIHPPKLVGINNWREALKEIILSHHSVVESVWYFVAIFVMKALRLIFFGHWCDEVKSELPCRGCQHYLEEWRVKIQWVTSTRCALIQRPV